MELYLALAAGHHPAFSFQTGLRQNEPENAKPYIALFTVYLGSFQL